METTFPSRVTLPLRISCCGFADQMEDTRLLKRRCLKTLSKGESSGFFLIGKGMRCLGTGLKSEDVDVLERLVPEGGAVK